MSCNMLIIWGYQGQRGHLGETSSTLQFKAYPTSLPMILTGSPLPKLGDLSPMSNKSAVCDSELKQKYLCVVWSTLVRSSAQMSPLETILPDAFWFPSTSLFCYNIANTRCVLFATLSYFRWRFAITVMHDKIQFPLDDWCTGRLSEWTNTDLLLHCWAHCEKAWITTFIPNKLMCPILSSGLHLILPMCPHPVSLLKLKYEFSSTISNLLESLCDQNWL
jgi:hypothetical protein